MPFDQLSVCDSEAISSLYQLYPWLTSRHKINHKLSLIGPSHDEHKSLEEPHSIWAGDCIMGEESRYLPITLSSMTWDILASTFGLLDPTSYWHLKGERIISTCSHNHTHKSWSHWGKLHDITNLLWFTHLKVASRAASSQLETRKYDSSLTSDTWSRSPGLNSVFWWHPLTDELLFLRPNQSLPSQDQSKT